MFLVRATYPYLSEFKSTELFAKVYYLSLTVTMLSILELSKKSITSIMYPLKNTGTISEPFKGEYHSVNFPLNRNIFVRIYNDFEYIMSVTKQFALIF